MDNTGKQPPPAATGEPEVGRCIDCNYDLRGLSQAVCPECGRAFDPADSKSMNLGRPMSARARRLMGPPGKWFQLVLAVMIAFYFWQATHPGFYYMDDVFMGFMLWWLVLVLLVARGSLSSMVAACYKQPKPQWRLPRSVGFLLLLLMLTTLATIGKFPMQVGFWFSKPAMERLVTEFESNGMNPLTGERRAGIYLINGTRIHTRELDGNRRPAIVFETNHYDASFVYSPDGHDYGYNAGTTGALGGGWYWLAED